MIAAIAWVLVALVGGFGIHHILYSIHFRIGLPPGPNFYLFGLIARLPSESPPWITFWEWGQRYKSDVLYFSLLGRPMLVLNSYKAAIDLLENRGAIYSDRPSTIMSGELVGRKHTVFFVSSSSERFKAYRRMMQTSLNKRAAETYYSVQQDEAQKLLQGLLRSPENFRSLIRRFAGAVILKIAFGYDVTSDNDPLVQLADRCIRTSEEAAKPGWMVDSFPFLQYMPSWMPGAHFKRLAKAWKEEVYQMNDIPFDWVKKQLVSGTAQPSITSQLLASEGTEPITTDKEDLIKWVAAGLYAAGTDTTAAVMTILIWVMSLYPDVQRKAQEEIDGLLQNERLPRMEDQEALPYVCAVIKEVHRWRPGGPIALPHRLTQDDEYNGCWIPEGTTVLTNRWAMLHDPTVYRDPNLFKPERFMDSAGHPAEPSPEPMVFGFGRRSCMGVHVANASLFIQAVSILATFSIGRGKDDDGLGSRENVTFSTGIVAHISPFRCTITPRSENAIALIEAQGA